MAGEPEGLGQIPPASSDGDGPDAGEVCGTEIGGRVIRDARVCLSRLEGREMANDVLDRREIRVTPPHSVSGSRERRPNRGETSDEEHAASTLGHSVVLRIQGPQAGLVAVASEDGLCRVDRAARAEVSDSRHVLYEDQVGEVPADE